MLTGLAVYVPHLTFFWSIFHQAAIPLWLIAGLPIAIFVLLLHLTNRRLGGWWALLLTPIIWTGVEYARSELYYLRFAWLLPGQAAAYLPGVRFVSLGVYGLGFLYMTAAALAVGPRAIVRWSGMIALVALAILMYFPKLPPTGVTGSLHVAGVQLESQDERAVVHALDQLAIAHPEAQILVLSEYTFFGPVPPGVRKILRKHQRYLVAGGVRQLSDDRYDNTAFVVGPDGEDVFNQAKSVPVQFMTDGLPAPERRVWQSPWGKIGIAVCYDLSYSRVMDDFVREGAQGLIIPTMDLAIWGQYERRMLHGRMAPIRSAEYGIPTFGVWSSGESQLTDRFGRVVARGGYPGQGEMIAGAFNLAEGGRVPPDRIVAWGATIATGVWVLFLSLERVARWMKRRRL
jgi:apolipoprotein N-acyltransferase